MKIGDEDEEVGIEMEIGDEDEEMEIGDEDEDVSKFILEVHETADKLAKFHLTRDEVERIIREIWFRHAGQDNFAKAAADWWGLRADREEGKTVAECAVDEFEMYTEMVRAGLDRG